MKNCRLSHIALAILTVLASCARMGNPDGGWYDETPPRVVGALPADKGVNVKSNKVNIYFNEFIKIENATENVVISPPQIEAPEIKEQGKKIQVKLLDSLKANTTYTIDFSDAITDNNEGNPLGNYTYCFSTGTEIDTMEVSGHVLAAQNLEPVKGILVGLQEWDAPDSAFQTQPFLRVSRTDSRGHFVIKGVKDGKYRVYALQDMDGNYCYSQKSEMLAFNEEPVVTSCKPDVRQDTLWADSLHIRSIERVAYTHFLPDDIVLRAFTAEQTDRIFLKAERKEANNFSVFFSYGCDTLPELRGLNFDERDAFVVEATERNDTVTYWLRDTALVNQDTLTVEMKYLMTDSTGVLVTKTDTLEILSKDPYEKRMKREQKALEDWQKKYKKEQKAKRKRDSKEDDGEVPADSIPPMPVDPLKPDVKVSGQIDPDKNIRFVFKTPLAKVDSAMIHLYSKHDTLWHEAPFEFNQLQCREYELRGEWRPEIEYSLEIDSLAFEDIYGLQSDKLKQGFKVRSLDDYSTLLMNLQGVDGTLVVQLLDKSDNAVKTVVTTNRVAEFFYVMPGTYYMRLFVDRNGNGKWDTGDYANGLQAEEVFYYPYEIECKAKWDLTLDWNPRERNLAHQKPGAVTKQKGEKEKQIKNRNAERAKKLGIEYIPKMM